MCRSRFERIKRKIVTREKIISKETRAWVIIASKIVRISMIYAVIMRKAVPGTRATTDVVCMITSQLDTFPKTHVTNTEIFATFLCILSNDA